MMLNLDLIWVAAIIVVAFMIITAVLIYKIATLYQNQKLVAKRKKLEKEREEVYRAIESQKRFVANMSHEIRTPINTIIGLNEMNLRGDMTDDQAENCQNVVSASKMLLAIVNDILDFSKIESGKMDIIPEDYNTATMVNEVVNMNLSKIRAKGLDFELDLSPDTPSVLNGDVVRIKQILINIFTNAVKYTERGKILLQISAVMDESGEGCSLKAVVADTGKGMRPASMVHLFDAFQRIDEKENRLIEGTGLGMAITKQLTDLMGGTIDVDSIYGKGSTFTVMLPQRIVDKTPVGDAASALRSVKSFKSSYRVRFTAPKTRILIVDDNRMNLVVAAKLLSETKIEIDTAESGMAALELTKNNRYNCILMDHQMPVMDGIATLKAIREQTDGQCSRVPILALTANAGSGMAQMYERLGFQGYIVKPIDPIELENSILKFLPRDLVDIEETEDEDELLVDIRNIIKKKYIISVDSIADVDEETLEKYDIRRIPWYVETDMGRFRDVEELGSDNIIDYLNSEHSVFHVNGPSVEDYEEFFANLISQAEVVIHLATDMSFYSKDDNAAQAGESFGHVRVVQTGQLSSGVGICAVQLAKALENGMSVDQVEEFCEDLRDRIFMGYKVANTESLVRIGYLSRPVGAVLDTLGFNPAWKSIGNKMRMLGLYWGDKDKTSKRFFDRCLRRRPAEGTRVYYSYVDSSSMRRSEYAGYLEQKMGAGRVVENRSSVYVGAYGGEGAMTLTFLMEKR